MTESELSKLSKQAREFFRRKGKEGGKLSAAARLEKISPERRREIARKAGEASAKARSKVERETTTSEDEGKIEVQFWWYRRLGSNPPRAVFAAGLPAQQGALNTAITISPYRQSANVQRATGLISVRLLDAGKLTTWLQAHHWELKQPAGKAENSTP